MIKLTKEQILMLYSGLIKMTGGSDGIRNIGLLESALETPFQSYGGEELCKYSSKGSEIMLWIGKESCDGRRK